MTVKRGGSPRPIKDFIRPSGIPWVKIADATRCDGPNLFVTREFIKEEGLKKTVELQPGSLILSNSATPGLPKFLRLRACIHDGWLYFPDTGGLSNEFLYLAFLHFKEWSSPGLMDTFSLMKESVFHAENEEPVPGGI